MFCVEFKGLNRDADPHGLPATLTTCSKFSSQVPHSVSVLRKSSYGESATSSFLPSAACASSSVADDGAKANAQMPTDNTSVVSSMHSYAMPAYIRIPAKTAARRTPVRSASYADDTRASKHEPVSEDAGVSRVSFPRLFSVRLVSSCVVYTCFYEIDYDSLDFNYTGM